MFTLNTASNKLGRCGWIDEGSELWPNISNKTGSDMKKNLGKHNLLDSETNAKIITYIGIGLNTSFILIFITYPKHN